MPMMALPVTNVCEMVLHLSVVLIKKTVLIMNYTYVSGTVTTMLSCSFALHMVCRLIVPSLMLLILLSLPALSLMPHVD